MALQLLTQHPLGHDALLQAFAQQEEEEPLLVRVPMRR
jgi:hypothetical protein